MEHALCGWNMLFVAGMMMISMSIYICTSEYGIHIESTASNTCV